MNGKVFYTQISVNIIHYTQTFTIYFVNIFFHIKREKIENREKDDQVNCVN